MKLSAVRCGDVFGQSGAAQQVKNFSVDVIPRRGWRQTFKLVNEKEVPISGRTGHIETAAAAAEPCLRETIRAA